VFHHRLTTLFHAVQGKQAALLPTSLPFPSDRLPVDQYKYTYLIQKL
jgi:hypothetical protein